MNKKIRHMFPKAFLSACAVLLLTACTMDFDNFNTNPNEVTPEQAAPVLARTLFLQMQQNVIVIAQPGTDIGSADYQVVEMMGGGGFINYWGHSSPNINSAGRFNWSNLNWYGGLFVNNYLKTMNAWRDLKSLFEEDDPQFALAQILKVAAMHRVTDTYGPIPYTKFGETLFPPYDSQKDVYYAMFDELEAAVKILEPHASTGNTVFASYDCIYSGNLTHWIKFANTLRLRLALHIAYVDPTKARSEADKAVNNTFGVMSQLGDLAQLRHISPLSTYESPIYIVAHSWQDSYMGATMQAYLNGYEDPRRASYFLGNDDNEYVGIGPGLSGNISKEQYTGGDFSLPNVSSESNVIWMKPSEAYFLRAEGALYGWTEMGGTARELYEEGIAMAFQEANANMPSDYLTNSTRTPTDYRDPVNSTYSWSAPSTATIPWNNSGGEEELLEKIMIQKYIAMYPLGNEAWTEFRRTGYPKVFTTRNSENGSVTNGIIRRLPYPVSEYDTNRELVEEGVALLGGGSDNPGVRLWWDVKN